MSGDVPEAQAQTVRRFAVTGRLDPVVRRVAHRPFGRSPVSMFGLLRRHLGFGGRVVADDHRATAIITADGPAHGGSEALQAGSDMLLVWGRPLLNVKIEGQAWTVSVAGGKLEEDDPTPAMPDAIIRRGQARFYCWRPRA